MPDVLLTVACCGGVHVEEWKSILDSKSLDHRYANWVFGRRNPFMYSVGDRRFVTAAGLAWATRA
jgi:hypothetical protein